jgi:hypothetical protein
MEIVNKMQQSFTNFATETEKKIDKLNDSYIKIDDDRKKNI